jgi:hypothetical protein
MAEKRKTRKKKPEKEYYEIQLEDWEVDYHFGLNTGPKDLLRRAKYCLHFHGSWGFSYVPRLPAWSFQ